MATWLHTIFGAGLGTSPIRRGNHKHSVLISTLMAKQGGYSTEGGHGEFLSSQRNILKGLVDQGMGGDLLLCKDETWVTKPIWPNGFVHVGSFTRSGAEEE